MNKVEICGVNTAKLPLLENNDKEELIGEISDLFYHLFVLMINQGVSLDDIENKLKERHKITGNKKEFHTRGEY